MKTQRRHFFIFVSYLCVMVAAYAASPQTVRIGVYEFHPIVTAATNQDAVAKSIYGRLVDYIALQEGWHVEFVPGTLREGYERLESGEIDVLAAAPRTQDQEVRHDFSRETIISTWAQMYANRDSDAQSLLDFDGRVVGVVRDDPYNYDVRSIVKRLNIRAEFIEFKDYSELLAGLNERIVDFAVVDRIHGFQHAGEYDLVGIPVILSPLELRFAVAKGKNIAVLRVLDYHINALKDTKDSLYHVLVQDAFGLRKPFSIPSVLKYSLVGLVGLTIAFAAASLMLRRQVGKQTMKLSMANTQLLLAQTDLEHKVEKRTRDLKQAKNAAELANRAKSQFLASMSHELRTPLNCIIGFSEVLYEKTFGDLNEKQTVYVERILKSGNSLLHLISDILDLSKIEADRMVLEKTQFKVETVLDEVKSVASVLASKKNIDFSVHTAPGIPMLVADIEKFKQILFNLISNAVKFTGKGGSASLRVGCSQDGVTRCECDQIGCFDPPVGYLHVSVKDNGIGIVPEQQARLFQIFEQLDASYARSQEGTGLGLYLCRKLVALHKGSIWVESEGEGRGSTFCFVMPFSSESMHEDEE